MIDAKEFYDCNGYYMLPNAIKSDECKRLKELAKRLPEYSDRSFGQSLQPHRIVPEFLDATKNKNIVNLIEKFVNGQASAIQTQFFSARRVAPDSRPIRIISLFKLQRMRFVRRGLRSTMSMRKTEH